jgi:hypothetical protein
MRCVSEVPLAVHSDAARRLKCKRNVLYMLSTCYQLVLHAEGILALSRTLNTSLGNYCLVQAVVYFPRIIFLFYKSRNPGGGEIFRTRPDRPWDPPSLLYNG